MNVLGALAHLGLLPVQDRRLPCVVTLLTGEAPRTSWWSHPQGRQIYAALAELADHADVIFTKLLDGKVTLVHRRLWSDLLAVAAARERWQTLGLSAGGRTLVKTVDAAEAPIFLGGPVVKEVERRLLVHAGDMHTASGRHAMALESWTRWSTRVDAKPSATAAVGREKLEAAATALGAPRSALPWS